MTGSGRTTRPPRATKPLHAVHERAHLAPFRRRPEPFQLTSANPRHASSGWGETPLGGGVRAFGVRREPAADTEVDHHDDGQVADVAQQLQRRGGRRCNRRSCAARPRTRCPATARWPSALPAGQHACQVRKARTRARHPARSALISSLTGEPVRGRWARVVVDVLQLEEAPRRPAPMSGNRRLAADLPAGGCRSLTRVAGPLTARGRPRGGGRGDRQPL